jgi:hypothetical protein
MIITIIMTNLPLIITDSAIKTIIIITIIITTTTIRSIIIITIIMTNLPLIITNSAMDLFPNKQNFDLDKFRQTFHHSLKEHHKISNIPKFRCELL